MEISSQDNFNIGDLLTPLETAVCHSLTLSITGKNDLNDHMRRIIALLTRLGGVSLDNPQSETESEYPASHNICHPIADLILQQWQLNPAHWRSKDRQGQQSDKTRDKQQQRTPGCSWRSCLMTPYEWLIRLLKTVHPTGWRSCLWMSMAFICTRRHSGMLSV